MDGCSSWETQWSNDPITPSIFDRLSEEDLMGIDGYRSVSGSGSKSVSFEDDDVISLFDNYGSGPPKRVRREDPDGGVNISFRQGSGSDEADAEAIQQMKEMIYRAAAFRPVTVDMKAAERPKRRNIRISSDPQTVAARKRRERISEKLRVLQKLVPGGSKMDTASMLDEAANYLRFLRTQVKALEGYTINKDNQFSNYPGNYLFCPPVSLQFSSLPFTLPMQESFTNLQNPNHLYI